MRSLKAIVILGALTAFAVLFLLNTLRNPSSQDALDGAGAPGLDKDGGRQEKYIDVETPSGIERLRAERITFVLLNTGKLARDAQLSVSGYLFGEGEEVVISIHDENGRQEVAIGTAWTDKEGNLPWFGFNLPDGTAPGKHTVRVQGLSSGRQGETSFTLRAGNPWVTPSTYSGKPNSAVELSGGGYFPGETVSVHFDTVGGDPIGVLEADGQGNIVASVRVPYTSEGSHALIIVGEKGNSPVRIPFSMLGFHPWGALSNYSPQPNQAVGFSGHDFVPGEEVRVYLNQLGPEAAAIAVADEEGNFAVPESYLPPPEAVGESAFLFVGSVSQTVVEVPIEILPLTPALELTIYAGLPGSPVGFTGQGFVPGETLRAYIGKPEPGKEVSVFDAGEDGGFKEAGTFSVPYEGTGSSVTITLVGDRSRSPASIAFAVLPYSPWANLSAYFGPPGTAVVIDGGGFAPGENVTVRFQNRQSPPVLTVPTGPEGSFQRAGPIAVPSTGGENTQVVIVGEKSGAEVIASFAIRTLEQSPETVPSPPANEVPPPAPTAEPPDGPGQEPGAASTDTFYTLLLEERYNVAHI